jgi:hypothetical protein
MMWKRGARNTQTPLSRGLLFGSGADANDGVASEKAENFAQADAESASVGKSDNKYKYL